MLREARRLVVEATARPADTISALQTLDVTLDAPTPLEAALLGQARGLALRSMMRLRDAGEAFDAAMAIVEEHHLWEEAARIGVSRAGNHAFAGRLDAALEDLSLAQTRARGTAKAEVQHQRAAVVAMAGQFEEGLRTATAALAAFRRTGNQLLEARALHNRSMMYLLTGRVRPGIRDAKAAIAAYERLGDEAGAAICEHNLAGLRAWNGDIHEALRGFNDADDRMRRLGVAVGPGADARGEALLTVGLSVDALELAMAAAEEHRLAGARLLEAEALLLGGRAALALGDHGRAASLGEAAAEIFDEQGRSSWASRARLVVGQAQGSLDPAIVESVAGELNRLGWDEVSNVARRLAANAAIAIGDFGRARSLLETIAHGRSGGLLARIARTHARATLSLLEGDNAGALKGAGDGLRLAHRHRRLLGTLELRSAATSMASEVVSVGMRAASANHDLPTLWRWSERARIIEEVMPDSFVGRERDLVAQHRAISAQIDAEVLSGRPSHPAVLQRRRKVEALLRDVEQIGPGTADRVEIVSLAALRRRLGDRVFVALSEMDGQLMAFRVTQSVVELRLVGRADALAARVDHLRVSLLRLLRTPDDQTASEVRRRLAALDGPFAPIFGADDSELVIVPVGRLFAMPWSMLPSVANRPVSVAMSATRWSEAPAPHDLAQALVVIGPGLDGAVREGAAVAKLWPGARRFSGESATASAVERALQSCDIAHVAAHASLRPDNPSFSAIHLADGPLYVRDLDRLHHVPQVVVLSACSSATSLGHRGAEVQGMAARLLARGVRTVVAPVLPISDFATIATMEAFHRGLRERRTASDSLARARSLIDPADHASAIAAGSYVCLGRAS